MRLRPLAVALCLATLVPVSANAATMVLGGGQAQTCYDEAKAGRATEQGRAGQPRISTSPVSRS